MLRVLQVDRTNPLLWSKTLKNYEVDILLTEMRERKRKRISRSSSVSSSSERRPSVEQRDASMQRSNHSEEKEMQLTSNGRTDSQKSITSGGNDVLCTCGGDDKNEEDEDICPICLLEMVEGESLTVHINGCGNSLHHHCMAICM
jgi:mitogen-activated protein kinase kinase kinase 1